MKKLHKFKIKGMPKDTDFNGMIFGRQIEWFKKIEQFKNESKSSHISQKRQSYSTAIRDFIKLNNVTEYYCCFFPKTKNAQGWDDSFQIWYK